MGRQTYYRKGSYNVVCDSCGFKFKAEELRLRWDGFYVCQECWNPRQEQDLVRPRPEHPDLPYVRPEPPDHFLNVCSVKGIQGVAGKAMAGCAVPEFVLSE